MPKKEREKKKQFDHAESVTCLSYMKEKNWTK